MSAWISRRQCQDLRLENTRIDMQNVAVKVPVAGGEGDSGHGIGHGIVCHGIQSRKEIFSTYTTSTGRFIFLPS